ncbi:MAG TPA: prolyl oligopeptidase family serine peptidase [Burkholderiales bacterium]|nr:prolyl oligopeptidase family serine peptidase [Burkholderiales bacterium]
MFEYFPGNYSWNLAVLMAAQLGGEMSEIDAACRPLRALGKDDPGAAAAWAEGWSALARRVEALAGRDEAAGHALSAGRKYLRACVYWLTAERMASHRTPLKLKLYGAMLECFRRGVTLRGEPLEWVEVPYEGTTLPALLHRAPGAGPRPAMIHFDGFDVTKEWMVLCGMTRELALRGVSSLVLDHPGVGGALRLQGLPVNHDTERWAAAALDWLERREDVVARRVGVLGVSLGGYFAPRAAAFEKRLAACVAWGARWDNAGSHGRILRDPGAARSVSGWVEHALWYYGAATPDEAYGKIAQMTLEGIAGRITCPLLVVHGAGDRQVPREQAERTVREAVNSPRAELRVFTAEEGGAEHVGGELFSPTIDFIADWVAEVL